MFLTSPSPLTALNSFRQTECKRPSQYSKPMFTLTPVLPSLFLCHETLGERLSLSFPALRDRERSQNWTMLTLYTGQLLVPTQKLLGIVYSVTTSPIWLSTLEIAKRSFAPLQIACSQTLYFLIKVRRARVIKNEPRGIYWPPAQGGRGEGGWNIFLSRARQCFPKERKEK